MQTMCLTFCFSGGGDHIQQMFRDLALLFITMCCLVFQSRDFFHSLYSFL